jgi:hypothetical protein
MTSHPQGANEALLMFESLVGRDQRKRVWKRELLGNVSGLEEVSLCAHEAVRHRNFRVAAHDTRQAGRSSPPRLRRDGG